MYCLNTSDGGHLWNFTTGGAIFSSPAIANGIVYVGSTDSYLYAFGMVTSPYTVEYGGQSFDVDIVSNSMLSAVTFDQVMKTLRVNVTGDPGTTGVCTVTFPTALLGGPYWIFVDDVECNNVPQVMDPLDSRYYLVDDMTTVEVMYDHSTHTITIIGTTVIPEIPTPLTMGFLLLILTVAMGLVKRIR